MDEDGEGSYYCRCCTRRFSGFISEGGSGGVGGSWGEEMSAGREGGLRKRRALRVSYR